MIVNVQMESLLLRIEVAVFKIITVFRKMKLWFSSNMITADMNANPENMGMHRVGNNFKS